MISYLQAIILGILQGLTEFLPVSSSGHLVLGQQLLGLDSPGVVLEVVLHLGTLVSVLVIYWQDVTGLVRGFFSLVTNPTGGRSINKEVFVYRRMVLLIVVGVIPTALIGLLLEPVFDRLFDTVLAVGFALIITGIILFLISRLPAGRRDLRKMTVIDALVIGLAQGCAITPGLSRSGMTISSALGRGLTRDVATRFSFLISLPAIGGAALLKLGDIVEQGFQGGAMVLIVGFLAAAISGIFAIKLLVRVLNQGKLQYFAYYVWLAGAITIWLNW